jgi:hypothetical protein
MRRPRKPVPPNTVTVRPFVATMTQTRQFMSELRMLFVEEPIRRSSNRSILSATMKVVLMQSVDLFGAQRDNRITPAEADVRVTAFCLGKLTDFLSKAERFLAIVESKSPDAVGRPPLAIASLLVRPEAPLSHLPD